jgi:hypothetical protein
MAEIDPSEDEEPEIGANEWVVEVVEGFGGLNVVSETAFPNCIPLLTARKKSLISWVMKTPNPM